MHGIAWFATVMDSIRTPFGSLAALALLAVGLSTGPNRPAAGAEWNQFRGPNGDGHAAEATLPLQWSADGREPTRQWKVRIPGKGWSSPVVLGDAIYLTTAVSAGSAEDESTDVSLRLIRVNLHTGRIELEREIFRQDGATAPPIHDKNSHASPTPIVVEDRIYVHFGHQGTACLDLNGEPIWKNNQLAYEPQHGNGGSPILVDDLLIFSCDAASDPFLVALDASTGQVRWKLPRTAEATKKFSFCTPTLIEADGQWQVICPGSNVVSANDPATGRELWQVRYEGYSVVPKPVWGDGMVYVCTGFDSPSLLAIRTAGATGDVTDTHVAWKATRGIPHTPSLILHDGLLFMVSDDGIASCLDAKTGQNLWRERLGGNFSSSPILAGDRIYFFSEEGKTYVIRAARSYELLAENDLDEQMLASCAVVDQSLIVRTADHLYRFAEPNADAAERQ
ncbi:MAG: PQQ-binding-like beta-propeller repeat protein [Pirellulales bacterium]